MPLRKQPAETLQNKIAEMLERLAKLYAIPNFDEVSSTLLSDWIMEEYKHTSFELIKTALTSPPIGKEKSWRLTPETVAEWIETTRIKIIDDQQRKESLARQTAPLKYIEDPEKLKSIDKLLDETKQKLAADIKNDKTERQKLLEEIKSIQKEDKERSEGRKSFKYTPDPLAIERQEKLLKAIQSRGLHECHLSELKIFKVTDKDIRARTQEEAEEIFIEVYS